MRRVAAIALCTLSALIASTVAAQADSTPTPRRRVHLPVIIHAAADACQPIPGASYKAISVNPPVTDRPAEAHGDLNLALRGYVPTNAYLGLVSYGGASDARAPQLAGLFADRRIPTFVSVHRVYNWDWSCNCRGAAIASPEVTLARLGTAAGEIISLPSSGYTIGSGYQALVLYASSERLALTYTRNDNIVHGYALHLEDLCVEPSLLALYQAQNGSGRAALPALKGGQALGRARGEAIGVAIRDSGTFLDPRSGKDWWQAQGVARRR